MTYSQTKYPIAEVLILKSRILSFAVSVAILGSFTTYVEFIQKPLGYVISTSAISFSALILVSNRRIFVKSLRLLRLSPWFWFWGLVLLVTQLVASFHGLLTLEGLVRTIGYVMLFALTYFVLSPAVSIVGEKIWPSLGLVISIASLIGVLGSLGFITIGVTPWKMPVVNLYWTSSILVDANYFAVVALIGLISSLYGGSLSKTMISKSLWNSLVFIHLFAIFVSYSRAAYLATAVAAMVWFLTNEDIRWQWKYLLVAIASGIFGYLATWMSSLPVTRALLEVDRGLTGRELLWPAALQEIAERPLFGWGVGNVDDVVLRTVGHWTSTHNTFLDFAIMAGVPGLMALVWVVIASITPLFKNNENSQQRRFLLTLLSGLLITSQFITFTPGGASFNSLIFTLALGQANALRIRRGRWMNRVCAHFKQ